MFHRSQLMAITCLGASLAFPATPALSNEAPVSVSSGAPGADFAMIDVVTFGDADSEAEHQLDATQSEVVTGGLDEPARQLLPGGEPDWVGGNITFTMRVDPEQPNYVTVRFWGDDAGEERGRLVLYIDGKQVGQRHLGEVDILDILADEPRLPGRFFYKTLPLPANMTTGKDTVELTIQSTGPIWAYGDTWDRFQKPLESPSRGIYAAYTHTGAYFQPPSDTVQGAAPEGRVRDEPGPEVLEAVKARVNTEIDKIMRGSDEMRQVFLQFLAKAYHEPWTDAYQNEAVIEKVVRGLDFRYRVFQDNPDIVRSDRETWNHDWFGYGPTGEAIHLLADELKPHLDEGIAGTDVSRREGWADMLIASRDWHVTTRRQYTNQSMIKDLYGIYLSNRGVAVVAPERAWPEDQARRFLYESVGLEPWRGSFNEDGQPTYPLGEDFMQLTKAGLTKELGYVGSYGEVVDWVVHIYNATRPRPDAEGDPRIKNQLVKIAQARAAFRHPAVDADGHRTMRLEQVIGWRDHHYPGDVVYDQRPARDGGPLEAAAATMDPTLIGYGKQMLEDNQFFAATAHRMSEGGFRVTAGVLAAPAAYETIRSAADPGVRLPMAPDQPDFVFADPEVGAVAIKNGDEILYASLYWRARYAINNLARVHHLTPTTERDATARQQTWFQDSGMVFEQPDTTNEPHTPRHEHVLKDAGVHLATAGIEQPIARIPDGVKGFRPGRENIHAGKGDFYVLHYGSYLIAMNCTGDRSFDLDVPEAFDDATDLVTRQAVSTGTVEVEPGQTVVLYR